MGTHGLLKDSFGDQSLWFDPRPLQSTCRRVLEQDTEPPALCVWLDEWWLVVESALSGHAVLYKCRPFTIIFLPPLSRGRLSQKQCLNLHKNQGFSQGICPAVNNETSSTASQESWKETSKFQKTNLHKYLGSLNDKSWCLWSSPWSFHYLQKVHFSATNIKL